MNPQGDPSVAPEHIEQAMGLEVDGYAHLFSIRMFPPGEPEILLTFCPQRTVTWQGYTWTGFGISLTDYVRNTSGELSRPKLSLRNPDGVFNGYIHRRWMDNAEVCRYRILGPHLDANINSYMKNTWKVRRLMSLSRPLVIFELGEIIDGPTFLIPGRAYYPPEFPTVSV